MSNRENEDFEINYDTCPDGFCRSCWACRSDCEEPGGPYPRSDGIKTPEEWEAAGKPEDGNNES